MTNAAESVNRLCLVQSQFMGHSSVTWANLRKFMNDSADIKMAVDRLQQALQTLEGSIDPLLEKVNRLEKSVAESGDFDTDRARLAKELDLSEARSKDFETREAEFTALADDTTQELDRVIRQVREALGQAGGDM